MNGELKITDAMHIIDILTKNGIDAEFCDSEIHIRSICSYNTENQEFVMDSIGFIPVSEKFVDIDDAFAYTIILAKKYKWDEYLKALDDIRVRNWITQYDDWTTKMCKGSGNYGELAVEGGMMCYLDTLISPNTKHDCIEAVMDVLTHNESWEILDETEKWLISELFAIRTIYGEKLN